MTLRRARYVVARWLIHAGLWVLPDSRCKSELLAILRAYREHILRELAKMESGA